MSDTQHLNDRGASMRDLVQGLAQALVDDQDSVLVDLAADDLGITIRLRVAPADLGKVIGKQGRTARSLRIILQAASMKHQERYSLDIESSPQLAG